MSKYAIRGRIAAIAAAVLAAACAGTPLPDRTLVLGEVAHVLTRQEILTGDVNMSYDNQGRQPVRLPRIAETLKTRGLADADLQDGSVVLMRFQYYRHNAASGIVRQHLRPAIVTGGLRLQTGNIVELEAQGGLAVVVRVRNASLQQGECGYRETGKGAVFSALDAVNPIGGSRAVSLDCAGLAAEGWTRQPFGYGFEWHRAPAP